MRAILVDAEREIERRRGLGLDNKDELWHGVWHLVHPPKAWHAFLNSDMLLVLAPLARQAGLRSSGEAVGVFADAQNWRVPGQAYARPDQVVEAGVTSAELVVEVRSPGAGVTEVLIEPVDDGSSVTLGVTFTTVDGPKLRIAWDGGTAEV